MRLLNYLLLAITALFFANCDIINPEEEIPAYLEIRPYEFSVLPGQGSASEKLSYAWLYVNGEYLGLYPLPATVPVLANGTTDITIDPGINDNGIAATPDIYPFYKRFETVVELSENETTIIQPRTSYIDEARFVMIEDFESNSNFFQDNLDNNDSTNVVTDQSDVFEGSGSGRIYITKDYPLIEVGAVKFLEFPPSGTSVYVELNYKAEAPMFVGWVAYDAFGNRLQNFLDRGINPKEEWNKIYFNFRETIREIELLGASSYQLVLVSAIPIENGEFTLEEATIMIDNVKVIQL